MLRRSVAPLARRTYTFQSVKIQPQQFGGKFSFLTNAGKKSVSPTIIPLTRGAYAPLRSSNPTRQYHSELLQARQNGGKSAMFYGAAGVGAGLLLIALFADGKSTTTSAVQGYSDDVRARINATYGYLAAGVGFTAAAATAMFRSGVAARMMMMNPWVLLGGSMVATIGSMMATMSIDYNNTIPKHLAWAVFNTAVAASLAPIGAVGGPIVVKVYSSFELFLFLSLFFSLIF